ncbi:hypothetical protein ACT4UL_04530 [Bacillus sp. HC-TM]
MFKLARKGDAFALRELLRVDKNLSLLPDFLSVGSDQHPERQRFVVQSSGTLPETRLSNTESFVTPIDMQGVFFLYFS